MNDVDDLPLPRLSDGPEAGDFVGPGLPLELPLMGQLNPFPERPYRLSDRRRNAQCHRAFAQNDAGFDSISILKTEGLLPVHRQKLCVNAERSE